MRLILSTVLLLLSSSLAWAEPSAPILLWGFQRGCEPLPELDRHVRRELEAHGIQPVELLAPGAQQLGCQGRDCAEVVVQECATLKGRPVRILGGLVDQNKTRTLTRLRLWMHDTGTGRTAWLDTYCQSCALLSAAATNAQDLIENPQYGLTLDTTPNYCRPDAPQKERTARSNKILWVVYGKDHNKSLVSSTVRKLVQSTGTEEPFEHVGKEYTLGVLKKIVAKDPGAQVFGAEIQGNGVIELFLFDGPTQLTQNQMVECPSCDKEELAEKIRQAGTQLLSHCFGDDCATAGTTRARPPAEACAAFPVPQCGGKGRPAMEPSPSASAAPAPIEISPRLARIAKGAVWGVFAANAVASAALLAANYAGAGRRDVGLGDTTDVLAPAAGALGGAALLSLAVAIPVTIAVNRALPPQAPTTKQDKQTSGSPSGLQCPHEAPAQRSDR